MLDRFYRTLRQSLNIFPIYNSFKIYANSIFFLVNMQTLIGYIILGPFNFVIITFVTHTLKNNHSSTMFTILSKQTYLLFFYLLILMVKAKIVFLQDFFCCQGFS